MNLHCFRDKDTNNSADFPLFPKIYFLSEFGCDKNGENKKVGESSVACQTPIYLNLNKENAHASRRRLHIVRRDYNENLAFFRPQTIANATIHIFGKSNELFQTGQQSEPYSSYLSSFESIRLVREVNGAGFPAFRRRTIPRIANVSRPQIHIKTALT